MTPLRIFFAVPRSAWVELNLRQSLEAMGHEVIAFRFPGWPDETDSDWQRSGKPQTNELLLQRFRQAHEERPVDLFFGYVYSSVAYPETIDLVRATGVPTVNFSCNNVHQFHLVEEIAPRFDLNIVPERAALASFERVGARYARLQLAANPAVYHPYPLERTFDVTFVGQRYADRAEMLACLARNDVSVHAWGAGWRTAKQPSMATLRAALALVEDEGLPGFARVVGGRLGRHLGGGPSLVAERVEENDDGDLEQVVQTFGGPRLLHRDLVRMFSRSRISLGFATAGDSHLGPKRLTHLRLREFEAPMSGALYLTEAQAELEEYFTPGQEVLTYRDADDLLDQVRFYLDHTETAERVRRAGYERALREHTWQHRFGALFHLLGLRG